MMHKNNVFKKRKIGIMRVKSLRTLLSRKQLNDIVFRSPFTNSLIIHKETIKEINV